LQETLERQRTTSDDLQNVLYSTDVATLFLDAQLAIRFFTPATRAMFHLIPSDIGRPLSDLHSLSSDMTLTDDARGVLRNRPAADHEIETANGASFMRRILPYRSQSSGVEGVVITFTDVTERNRVRQQLHEAVRRSEQANLAKSRFLASASHDLRQPLQALTLLQGLLAKLVEGPRAQQLMARLNETLGSMTGILDTLLDINLINAGVIQAKIVNVPIGPLLERLRREFSLLAEAKGLAFHCVVSSRHVTTDPVLLEQMLRNLLSNAIKYTNAGTVLLGCRRRGKTLWIEVWDTGIGIPANQKEAVFEEFHQVDNPARERNRGLGLGLSIVRRLGELIGHPALRPTERLRVLGGGAARAHARRPGCRQGHRRQSRATRGAPHRQDPAGGGRPRHPDAADRLPGRSRPSCDRRRGQQRGADRDRPHRPPSRPGVGRLQSAERTQRPGTRQTAA
jgi:two-component system CheB/CheR fusion protein